MARISYFSSQAIYQIDGLNSLGLRLTVIDLFNSVLNTDHLRHDPTCGSSFPSPLGFHNLE